MIGPWKIVDFSLWPQLEIAQVGNTLLLPTLAVQCSCRISIPDKMLSPHSPLLRRTRRLTPNQIRALATPLVLHAATGWRTPDSSAYAPVTPCSLDLSFLEESTDEEFDGTQDTVVYDSSPDDLDDLIDEETSDDESPQAAPGPDAAPYVIPQVMERPATSRTMTGRRRHYCFTWNNYTAASMEFLSKIECRGIGYGQEVAPSGTRHLQGWISFASGKTLSAVIKLLPGCHVETMLGQCAQSVVYCSKDGNYTTRGTVPASKRKQADAAGKAGGAAEKLRWKEALEAAQDGRLEDVPADIRFRYYSTVKRIKADHLPKPADVAALSNLWIYGPSGTGKSRKVRADYESLYVKLNNKWWDGYNGEETVLIDDFDKYDIGLTGSLKRWCDHYPFPAELKGSVRVIRPLRVVITSNYHPRDIWDDAQSLGPILRRFKVMHMPHPYGTVPPADTASPPTPVSNQSPVIGAAAPGFTFPQ